VAIEVPSFEQNVLIWQVEVTSTPGATTSGFILPSPVGPLSEKPAIEPASFTAPTPIAFLAQPGDITLLAP
jgi:hypothetical protein